MYHIDEVQKDIFRISYFDGYRIGFNQFLIRDEAPALIHTGQYQRYDGIREQIKKVMDPTSLRYIVIPHFEADECGGMDRFLAQAPDAKLLCSAVGAQINLAGWNAPPPLTVWQDDTLDLGRHRLRFLMTPHVHHWDSMMVFEESEGVLFPADLFIQPGDQPPTSRENLSSDMIKVYRSVGIMPSENAVHRVLDKLDSMPLRHVNPMHGARIPAEALAPYVRALREQPFAYNGTLMGKEVAPAPKGSVIG